MTGMTRGLTGTADRCGPPSCTGIAEVLLQRKTLIMGVNLSYYREAQFVPKIKSFVNHDNSNKM
jgi:hypothetical protein